MTSADRSTGDPGRLGLTECRERRRRLGSNRVSSIEHSGGRTHHGVDVIDHLGFDPVSTIDPHGTIEPGRRLGGDRPLPTDRDAGPRHRLIEYSQRDPAVHQGRSATERVAQLELGRHDASLAVMEERDLQPVGIGRLADEAVRLETPIVVVEADHHHES